jgi:putative phosphoesterase
LKIGVVSDSHKNLAYLDRAVAECLDEGCTAFIHLGDNYSDMENAPGMELIRVPGVYDPEYHSVSIPHRIVKEFEKARFVMTHAPDSHSSDLPSDLSPEELALRRRAQFILHGHTHIPTIEEKGNVFWINPGHLKAQDKKGYPASFSIIEIDHDEVDVAIFDLLEKEEMLKKQISLK